MINRLSVKNYKCLLDEKIDLNNLTILAGANAVGKSSIIQSILLLNKTFENDVKKEVLVNNFFNMNLGLPKDIIAKDRTSNEIYICAETDKFTNDVTFCVGDEITKPFSLEILNCEEIVVNSTNKECIFNSGFTYLNAERIGPRIALEMSSDINLNVGYQGEYTNHVIVKADRLKKEVHEKLKASNITKFSAQCESWLDVIIPGTQLEVDIFENVNKATIKYKNLESSSDFYVPTATGFGITYVLPIIVAGLLTSINTNSILIVENPEAHLHPYGQSQIGRFLAMVASCGVQVIIETHSEHVITGARLQLANLKETKKMSVKFFSIEEKKIHMQEIELNSHGELSKYPKGFFDQNKIDLRKLLELRLCTK